MTTARIHLHLRTRDLDASRVFYTALFGEPDKVFADLVRFQPEDLAISLSVMPGTPAHPHPEEHLGVKWPDETGARAAWERLDAAGLTSASTEEGVNCCNAVQDKRWFVDPDGRGWEVYTVLDDAPDAALPASPVSACCGVTRPAEEVCCA